jgi:hypothetical protein
MTDFRTTQIIAEVWAKATPVYQITDVFAEVWARANPVMQATDMLLELWAPNSTVGTRYQVSAVLAEVWIPIAHSTQLPFFTIVN